MTNPIPEEILALCAKVTAKRARVVIDHIIAHGFITTEDLKTIYGYDHPPRAIRDVIEQGIPLEKFPAKSSTGRSIAAYRFGDTSKIQQGRLGGRIVLPKSLKAKLLNHYGSRSTLSNTALEARYLQIDHRIPYDIFGNNADVNDPDAFMLLDASEQRRKSWECEHCLNFAELRDPAICRQCFWAYPENYRHVAMREERHLHMIWQGEETLTFDRLIMAAEANGMSPESFLKQLLDQTLSSPKDI